MKIVLNQPPLGLCPKDLLKQRRKIDIKEAIIRYLDANYPIPSEWVEEFNDILEELQDENRN